MKKTNQKNKLEQFYTDMRAFLIFEYNLFHDELVFELEELDRRINDEIVIDMTLECEENNGKQ